MKYKCPLCKEKIEGLSEEKTDVCVICAYKIWQQFTALIKPIQITVSTKSASDTLFFGIKK